MTRGDRNGPRRPTEERATPAPSWAGEAHDHLVETCPVCAEEWRRLGDLRGTYQTKLLDVAPPGRTVPEVVLPAGEGDLEEQEERTAEARRRNLAAHKEKSALLLLPAGERVATIHRARRRFRSLALAELLIEECRDRVRNAPGEAAEIVGLVRHVLAWTEPTGVPAEAPPLLARAAAHRANALRVAGDLPAADRGFGELRQVLAERPLADLAASAEIDSLEASLRIDQRRLTEADGLLERAATGFHLVGDGEGLARTMVKQGNMMQTQGRPQEILPRLERAAALLDPTGDQYLFVCTVTGRANALCDLGRFSEAQRLLSTHLDAYEGCDDLYAGAIYRSLCGRVALGLGDLAGAEEAFSSSREALLALGRDYDAALISLSLAEVLLALGKRTKLRRLAAELVAFFQGCGVAGEALAALRLFAQAVATEALTVAMLDTLRHKLSDPAVRPALSLT